MGSGASSGERRRGTAALLKSVYASCASPGPDDPGHPFRGISVSYLSRGFLAEVEAAGKARTAKVYEVEPDIIRGKGAGVTCPRDGRLGAAYVDCVQNGDAGAASVMLSYTWGYTVGDIIDGLHEFCQTSSRDLDQTFVWICCLCVNQHRVIEARDAGKTVPFEEFRHAFESRVRGIGHIVALMAPWQHPLYINRVWCVFELYTAVTQNCQVTITMPPAQADGMLSALLKADFGVTALEQVFNALGGICVADAEASVEADRTNILALIANGPGTAALDKHVSEYLRDWVLATFEARLAKMEAAAGGPEAGVAQLCLALGEVLAHFGELSRSAAVLEKSKHMRIALGTLELRDLSHDGSRRCCSGAIVLSDLGVIKLNLGDLKGAQAELQEAKRIRKENCAFEMFDGALLCCHSGMLAMKWQDLETARAEFEEGKRIHTLLGTLETHEAALLLDNLGALELQQGNHSSALANCTEAKRIYEATGTLQTPNAAMALSSIGAILMLQGDLPGAMRELEEARRIRSATATLETQIGSTVLQNLGLLKAQSGDVEAGLADLAEAKRIRIATASLGSSDGEMLLHTIVALHMQRGDFTAVVAEFNEAKPAFFADGTAHTHLSGQLLCNVGAVKLQTGDLDGAEEDLEEGRKIYVATQMDKTPAFAALLTNLGVARMRQGDRAAARTFFESAKKLFADTGTLETPNGSSLMQVMGELESG